MHMPLEVNKNLSKSDAPLVRQHMQEYKTGNRNVDDNLDQTCKDTDMNPCVKQHKTKMDGRLTIYAIHSKWQDLNHVVKQHKAKRGGRWTFDAIYFRWLGLNYAHATASAVDDYI